MLAASLASLAKGTRGGILDRMSDPGPGRRLQILARMGPAGPVAVAVTLVGAAYGASCGSDVVLSEPSPPSSNGAGGGGGFGGVNTAASSAGGFFPAASSTGGALPCGGFPSSTHTVTVPPEGVPATAGQICAVVMGPVESNRAARVTLSNDPNDLSLATGEVTVDAALLPSVVGLPTIEVVYGDVPALQQIAVSNVTPIATGFSFDAQWPPLSFDIGVMMIVRTTLDMTCGPNDTRQVQAHTHVNLCSINVNGSAWVSSGDECTICQIIAEMAPSPIVPDHSGDDVALGRVIRLRLVIVGRIGASLLLLAEHDGGPSLEYEWVAAGEVCRVTPDIVLWTPPPEGGPHLLQVAVQSDDAAAVASYTNVPVRDAGFVA